MPKRHKYLFQKITSPENFQRAYDLTCRGKRSSAGYLEFKQDAPARIAALRESVASGAYSPGPFRTFWVTEPKPRQIDAMSFSDRVVQHALHSIVEPIFDAIFHGRSYACRRGRGTHRGAIAVQADLRGLIRSGEEDVYFLKTDFRKYFHSISLPQLWAVIESKIRCPRTLALIEEFTPRSGVGLPIGNLTSQLWANLYGHVVDNWLIRSGARLWHRYMDDVVVIAPGRAGLTWLLGIQSRMVEFCREALSLTFSKWSVQHHARGINFLGYRIWPTHKLLRKSSVRRAKRTARALRQRGDLPAWQRWSASWAGHAKWADSANLISHLNLHTI
jgi:hypothetical protein